MGAKDLRVRPRNAQVVSSKTLTHSFGGSAPTLSPKQVLNTKTNPAKMWNLFSQGES